MVVVPQTDAFGGSADGEFASDSANRLERDRCASL